MANRNDVDNSKSEQLCWNCKRCTNPEGLYCPWAAGGKPVEGWEAEEGKEYFAYFDNYKKKKPIGKSFVIKECPLFIKDKKFATYSEWLKEIGKVVGINPTNIRSRIDKPALFKKYEKLTGNKLPYYVKHHSEEYGDFMN